MGKIKTAFLVLGVLFSGIAYASSTVTPGTPGTVSTATNAVDGLCTFNVIRPDGGVEASFDCNETGVIPVVQTHDIVKLPDAGGVLFVREDGGQILSIGGGGFANVSLNSCVLSSAQAGIVSQASALGLCSSSQAASDGGTTAIVNNGISLQMYAKNTSSFIFRQNFYGDGAVPAFRHIEANAMASDSDVLDQWENGVSSVKALVLAPGTFRSAAASGKIAFKADNAGAIWSLGGGPTAISDGTTVTFAGPIATTQSTVNTTAGLVLSAASGAGEDSQLYNPKDVANYAQQNYTANTGTNVVSQFYVFPKGTGSGGRRAQILVGQSDYKADNTNYSFVGMRAKDAQYNFGTGEAGTGVAYPIGIGVSLLGGSENTYAFYIDTANKVGVGGNTSPAVALDVTGAVTASTNLTGAHLFVPTGTGASCAGTGTLTGGTQTISTTCVTANSLILLTDTGGTVTNLGTLYVSAKTASTSFVVNSSNVLDASNFNWLIVN